MQAQGTIRPQAQGRKPPGPFEGLVRVHLDELLHSSQFDASARSRAFLRFVVDEALAGHGDRLNQTSIAMAVFARGADFDAVLDPIVRVQAGRLRRSLERYYLLAGNPDGVRIELPKGHYAPSFVTDMPAQPTLPTLVQRPTLTPILPVLVVQPFSSTCDIEAELADNILDELTTELHRHGELTVLRQRDVERLDVSPPVRRFELHGKVRRSGADVLLAVRLVDRSTAEELWSEEFRAHPEFHAFLTITDIAQIVAARVGGEQGLVLRALTRLPAARADASEDTLAALLRCQRFYFSRDLADLPLALDAARRIVTQQPECATAWLHLARLSLLDYSLELTDAYAPVERAIDSAYRAVLLDPSSARARCTLAAALIINNETPAALREVEHVIALTGHSLAHRETIGWLVALAGRWERGAELLRDATARNPALLPRMPHVIWADSFQRGDFESARIAALECRGAGFFWPELMLAASLGYGGRAADARAGAVDLLRVKPSFLRRGHVLIGHYIKCAELRERISEGLERCGLVVSA